MGALIALLTPYLPQIVSAGPDLIAKIAGALAEHGIDVDREHLLTVIQQAAADKAAEDALAHPGPTSDQ